MVGLFTADGSSFESEMWGDYNALAPAMRRNGGCESVTVRHDQSVQHRGFR